MPAVLSVSAIDPTQVRLYHDYLRAMMQHRNQRDYPKMYHFTPTELSAVTPDDIYKWMCLKVYGFEDPDIDDKPTLGRSTSLAYYKKAISFFMPNKRMTWNEITNQGNPTRSAKVNDLIKAVRKKEVRGQGKESSEDRPFELIEIQFIFVVLHSNTDFERRYLHSTLFKFQIHMIARLDDTCHLLKSSMMPCDQFDFAVITRLRWSKNVNTEDQAPEQIMLASMDHRYCIHLALAICLEIWIAEGEGRMGDFVFVGPGTDDEDRPKQLKDNAYRALYAIHTDNSFPLENRSSKLGTHSIRKFAYTLCRRQGKHCNDIDHRGRWKRDQQARSSVRYCDKQIPWVDIDICTALCIGGAIKYKLKDGSGVCDEWLCAYVTPHIAEVYGSAFASVLAKALLWASFFDTESGSSIVPQNIRQRVLAAYNLLPHRLPNGVNPVEKVFVKFNQVQGRVYATELDSDQGQTSVAAVQDGEIKQLLEVQFARMVAIERKQDDMQNEMRQMKTQMLHQMQTMSRNIGRIALQPVSRVVRVDNEEQNADDAAGNASENGVPFVATLSACPRDLYTLWQEWEFGIAGRKPAKTFTRQERGRVKFKYSRRLLVWEVLAHLVRAGYTSHAACDKLYEIYGHRTVSELIDKIRVDKRGNTLHPDLL